MIERLAIAEQVADHIRLSALIGEKLRWEQMLQIGITINGFGILIAQGTSFIYIGAKFVQKR